VPKLKCVNTVKIRCYRECRFNTFHKSNCGYCVKSNVSVTNDGCMDFERTAEQGVPETQPITQVKSSADATVSGKLPSVEEITNEYSRMYVVKEEGECLSGQEILAIKYCYDYITRQRLLT
jgi:hypothetical protein